MSKMAYCVCVCVWVCRWGVGCGCVVSLFRGLYQNVPNILNFILENFVNFYFHFFLEITVNIFRYTFVQPSIKSAPRVFLPVVKVDMYFYTVCFPFLIV